MKQQSQFIEQLDVDAETEKKELFNQHMKLGLCKNTILLISIYNKFEILSKFSLKFIAVRECHATISKILVFPGTNSHAKQYSHINIVVVQLI